MSPWYITDDGAFVDGMGISHPPNGNIHNDVSIGNNEPNYPNLPQCPCKNKYTGDMCENFRKQDCGEICSEECKCDKCNIAREFK